MIEEIQDRLNAEPFIPFALFGGGGHRFEIGNSNALTIANSVLYFVDLQSDRYAVIRINQLSHLEVLGQQPKKDPGLAPS